MPATLVFSNLTKEHGTVVEWRVEPRRVRSYLTRRPKSKSKSDVIVARAAFPKLVYAIVKNFGVFHSLHVFTMYDRVPLSRHTILYPLPTSNLLEGNYVCLGNAHTAVVERKLDPIEAFWMTRFDSMMPWRDDNQLLSSRIMLLPSITIEQFERECVVAIPINDPNQ